MAKGKITIGRSGLWRPTVHPYLEQLALQLQGKNDNSVSVDIEGVRILVTPLEQELVLAMAEDEDSAFNRRHILVRDGLGLRIKILSELNRLAQESSTQRIKTIEAINEDIGLGCQLMHEITLEMREISNENKIEEARDFSQYRQQLSRTVSEAERRVANRSAISEDTNVWDPPPEASRQRPAQTPGHTPAPRRIPQSSRPTGSRQSAGIQTAAWIALTIVLASATGAAIWYFLL